MSVDVDRLAVLAVAGEVGNVVPSVEILHAPYDRVEGAVHHQAGHVPLRQTELLVRGFRVAEVKGHGGSLGANRRAKVNVSRSVMRRKRRQNAMRRSRILFTPAPDRGRRRSRRRPYTVSSVSAARAITFGIGKIAGSVKLRPAACSASTSSL